MKRIVVLPANLETGCSAAGLLYQMISAVISSLPTFTAPWLSSDIKLEHEILAMKPFLDSHTGENIVPELNTFANSWGIDYSEIHLLIHDIGANLVKNVRLTLNGISYITW